MKLENSAKTTAVAAQEKLRAPFLRLMTFAAAADWPACRTTCSRIAILCALVFAAPTQADGDVIYDNGAFDTDNAFLSDLHASFPEQSADDFVLTSGQSTITDVHWWGVYSDLGVLGGNNAPDGPDDFSIRIFADAGAAPGAIPIHDIAVGDAVRVDTGIDTTSGFDIYAHSADIPATPLVAGATYWLSIVNDTAADNDQWFWATSPAVIGDNSWFRTVDGNAWIASTLFNEDLAFNLTNDAVPEPSSLALLVLGTMALIGIRRRRVRH